MIREQIDANSKENSSDQLDERIKLTRYRI